jgi:hypothetical protein
MDTAATPSYSIRPKYAENLKKGGDHSGNGFEVYSRGLLGRRLSIYTYSFSSALLIRSKLSAGTLPEPADYF